MGHCGGGPGLTSVEVQSALERWVEQGQSPERLIGSREGLTRPVCPFPAHAIFSGAGDPARADSFICRAPPAPNNGASR
jgi:feruloyl esterase